MYVDKKIVMKALTSVAIEKALLDIGKPFLNKVSNKLQKEYNCYIPDCYEHPEYLDNVLRSIFGNSTGTVVESIRELLAEYLDDDGIHLLVQKIGA